ELPGVVIEPLHVREARVAGPIVEVQCAPTASTPPVRLGSFVADVCGADHVPAPTMDDQHHALRRLSGVRAGRIADLVVRRSVSGQSGGRDTFARRYSVGAVGRAER